ncbi:MAG: 2-oxo acid dehydrogenase subunit E2 [Bacteroidia bacterium]|jgi:2-oxoglutarate dehydrogenase E2 component (dihydrolipoamide succinyltransferase)|nr:2-oxo acid dehydrogenase subunit E2 [Bacteroidia bacterium]
MADFELVMPKMGESIAEATIIRWTKNEGDAIAADETVLEIATDKVDSEVPSPKAGILKKILFKEGDVVAVGSAIAIIAMEGSAAAPSAPAPKTEPTPEVKAAVVEVEKTIAVATTTASNSNNSGGRFYSPLVLNIAKEEKIGMAELESIVGTGNEGRVTKKDILAYVQNRGTAPVVTPQPVAAAPIVTIAPESKPTPAAPATIHQAPKVTLMPGDELIEMDRMRKLIADHMVMSKHVSPHVTSFVEADVTNMVLWRDKAKKIYEKREGEKITFTPMFVECVVKAIKDYPMINVSVDGQQIVKRKNINIGMAAALPSGNLIVPVIKSADNMNLIGLTKNVNDLANRARANKLAPDEIQGGTFTLTNVGGFGNVMGTPIINQPQVAIMATGTIKKKPAVLETEHGDVIAIRHIMFLSLSYDHRVVDGSLGGSFLRRVADYMEQWDLNREI